MPHLRKTNKRRRGGGLLTTAVARAAVPFTLLGLGALFKSRQNKKRRRPRTIRRRIRRHR